MQREASRRLDVYSCVVDEKREERLLNLLLTVLWSGFDTFLEILHWFYKSLNRVLLFCYVGNVYNEHSSGWSGWKVVASD